MGYIDHGEGAALAYEASTRMVRILWSSPSVDDAIALALMHGTLPGGMPLDMDRKPPFRAHAYGDLRPWAHDYQGAQVCTIPVQQDGDRRRTTIYSIDAGRKGADFPEVPADMIETIYVTQGSKEIIPDGCEPLHWGAGDLIFWLYGRYQRNRYGAGLGAFCYFLSSKPLPDLSRMLQD